ncbi:conserved hypothetical protein [Candidatus Sulfopaludibacter sp. SbA3]|nr:conserved hypothetical protein [Candidatus Sulfopaludibacter sp. SbA3]
MQSVQFFWRDAGRISSFRTGVCLHGHTLHSEECLNFLPRYLHYVPGISQMLSRHQRGPQAIDFNRAWWTPPLTPACALRLEREQIAGLGLLPIVSLTDHDNVEAGLALQMSGAVPVSVEWTVPYHRTILHLGIHNLPASSARRWMSVMASHTAAPDERRLPEILSEIARIPEALIVLNHPFWLEEGVDEGDHRRALEIVLQQCNTWFHAFELNGTRRWKENAEVVELAREWSRPLISGGDRHACEPAACINLTNAHSFAEFAAEVRAGHSSVLFMPQYREPMPLRMLEAIWDILRPYPEYPGRELWTERTFYRGDDGVARSLSALWGGRMPWMIPPVTGTVQLFATSHVRMALRLVLSKRAEALP